jgi:hypothetical protein
MDMASRKLKSTPHRVSSLFTICHALNVCVRCALSPVRF